MKTAIDRDDLIKALEDLEEHYLSQSVDPTTVKSAVHHYAGRGDMCRELIFFIKNIDPNDPRPFRKILML